jgi:hypothetical protein
MQFLLLGFVALILVLLALKGYTRANPAVLARQLRVMGGVAAFAGAGLLLIRGLAGYAAPLAMLGSWLLWGQGGAGWRGWGRGPTANQSSRVVTDTLEVELDHDSGTLKGRVRTGRHAGRDLETLTPAELADLWAACRFSDPQSAQILEAWLDRIHPTWQDDLARRAGQSPPSPGGGPMTRAEAYEILGLEPGASTDEIRRAHRDLMMKMHPDRGGSTYLAAKINEAKDLLLGD